MAIKAPLSIRARLIWGGMGVITTCSRSLTLSMSGRLSRKTRVSMGSRKGSMEGFVTCEALISSLSQ